MQKLIGMDVGYAILLFLEKKLEICANAWQVKIILNKINKIGYVEVNGECKNDLP